MTVITISRQAGSWGDEIAHRLCEQLGLRYFDKQLMAQVAGEVGLSPGEIVDFSESNYKVRSLFDRLFRKSEAVAVAQARTWKVDASGVRKADVKLLDENQAISLVQATIRAAYQQGDVLIVGRGGQALLQDRPDVLHVRVEAPLHVRIQRVQEAEVVNAEMAEELVNRRDAVAAAYLRRFYDIDWFDPKLYHLILNTGKLSVDAAVATVVQAAAFLPMPA